MPVNAVDAAYSRQQLADLAPVQIKPDMTCVGTGADTEVAAAQEDWRKLQAAKAATADEPDETAINRPGVSVEDLPGIALLAQSGDAVAQQCLAQQVLRL